jgi:hypothetical protein
MDAVRRLDRERCRERKPVYSPLAGPGGRGPHDHPHRGSSLRAARAPRLTDERRSLIELAREALWAETMTDAGRVNLVGIAAIFLIVIGAGLVDVLQALVRIAKEDFETGLRSLLSFVWAYGVLLIACVVVLAAAEVISPRR